MIGEDIAPSLPLPAAAARCRCPLPLRAEVISFSPLSSIQWYALRY
jgi:hypothetical protein